MVNLKRWMAKVCEAFIFPVSTRQWNNIATPTASYYTVATFSPPANSAGIILALGGNGLPGFIQNKVFLSSNNCYHFIGGGSPNTSGAGNQSIGFAYFETTASSGATINVQQYGYDTSVTNMNGFAVMIRFPHVLRGGVISYLLHLTESLKSFAGRRWARYAEPQKDVDEAVRTGELPYCNYAGTNQRDHSGRCYPTYKYSIARIRNRNRGDWVLHSRKYTDVSLRHRARTRVCTDCREKYQLKFRYNNATAYLSRSGLTPASERGWWCA